MKKIMSFITIFLSVFLIQNVSAKTIKLKECEYTDEYIKWLESSEKYKKENPIPVACENDLKNKYQSYGSGISGVSVDDDKFNLRDYNFVTSVKNQESTNACWTFATNASIESNLLMNGLGEYDLSEAHLELATQDTYDFGRNNYMRTVDLGGNHYLSQGYFTSGWGPVEESYLPFSKYLDLFDENRAISSSSIQEKISSELITESTPILDINNSAILGSMETGTCSDTTIEDIKAYLTTEGALSANIRMINNQTYSRYLYYNGSAYIDLNNSTVTANASANHAVTIVGWDDTINKDKFTFGSSTAVRNGAFIIKNSYGEKTILLESLVEYKNNVFTNNESYFNSLGITDVSQITNDMAVDIIFDNLTDYQFEKDQIVIENDVVYLSLGDFGYQYVSYDDIHICSDVVGFYDVETEVEENVYGYSNLPSNYELGYATEEMYLLSQFTKNSTENEILEEVVMYFPYANQKYTVYFADEKTKNIDDSSIIATGTSRGYGYETIKIDNAPKITSNEFSIFVKLEDSEEVWFSIALNYNSLGYPNTYYNNFTATPDVQFISFDAIDYGDVAIDLKYASNLSIYVNTNLESTESTTPDDPVTPPADEDKTDTPNEEENETPTEDEEQQNPSGDEKEEDKKDDEKVDIVPDDKEDEINTDAKIEVEENEYNKENKVEEEKVNENVDKPLDKAPPTGLYIPIFIIGLIVTAVIVIKKNIKSKVFKI